MIERIILVTGSKGGGGKTPVSLSIALALQELGVPVLACDFNFNNADMLTILHGTNVIERKRQKMLDEIPVGGDIFWQIDKNLWLGRWSSIMELGLPSIKKLWDKVRLISYMEFLNYEPKVLVIDTNLTLPLICPSLKDIDAYPDMPPVEVWHLYSPSITLQIDEQERFVKAIDQLNRFNKGFEQRLTHIFTPRHHSTTSFFGTLASWTRGEFNLIRSKPLKQTNPKPVVFSEIQDALFASFLPKILNMDVEDSENVQELIKEWLNNILKVLAQREYRTNNVLIVPTVVHKIALLVEELTIKPRRTLKSIREDLGSLYTIVKEHFVDYRQDILSEFANK